MVSTPTALRHETIQMAEKVSHKKASKAQKEKTNRDPFLCILCLFVASLFREVFGSGEQFLNSACVLQTDCLIADFRMPGITGLELQERLNAGVAGSNQRRFG